jgi:hypothetical protein
MLLSLLLRHLVLFLQLLHKNDTPGSRDGGTVVIYFISSNVVHCTKSLWAGAGSKLCGTGFSVHGHRNAIIREIIKFLALVCVPFRLKGIVQRILTRVK